MSKPNATKPKPKPKPRARRPPGELPPLPSGTEAILGVSEAAAALGMRPHNFRRLLALKQVPEPDGTTPWNGNRFWKQSTINEFINSMTRGARPDVRGIQAGE